MKSSAGTPSRLGLALGGGSVRGYAHVGVLSVLEAQGLRPGYVAGTSAGAAVAAMYAFGVPPDALRDRLGQVNWRMISSFSRESLGLFSNEPIGTIVEQAIGSARIEEAPLPLAIVATDINTGEEVVLREGSVVDAVRASTCLPGLYVPVTIGGRMLVDGGLVAQVPVRPVRDLGAAVVVAVSLSSPVAYKPVQNVYEVLRNAFSIAMNAGVQLDLKLGADVLIEPDLHAFNAWDVDQLPDLFEKGVRAAAHALPSLRAALAAEP